MQHQDRFIRMIITAGLLLAITLLLVFTRIGLIPVPTPAGNATVAHIPAIIAGILQGPSVGLLVSFGFGFASFTNATIPMFKDPLVAILPRLFIGPAAAYLYMVLRRASREAMHVMLIVLTALFLLFAREIYLTTPWLGLLVGVLSVIIAVGLYLWMRRAEMPIVSLAIAGAAGSFTNTLLVLSVAVWRDYIPAQAAWGIGLTHGVPEMIVSALVVVGVATALRAAGGGGRSRLQREAEAQRSATQ